MTQAMTDKGVAPGVVTLSGRELAMRRRQAMAQLGKAGAGKTAAGQLRSAAHVVPAGADAAGSRVAMATSKPAAGVSEPGRTVASVAQQVSAAKPARARREALSQLGKGALPASNQRTASDRARTSPAIAAAPLFSPAVIAPAAEAAQSTLSASVTHASVADTAPATTMRAPAAPTGRALAIARRAVLSKEGKAGLKRVAQAVKIAATMPEQNWQAAISQGATGRQIAMQHRLVRSLAGRTDGETVSRPAGRVRPTVAKGESPVKVEEGHTLAGQRVTGTMVERSKLITGNEPGSARAITGTEYIGAEQFERSGAKRPPANPAKVGVTETTKGKQLTGSLVGHSAKVTGDEVGAERALTGTAYSAPTQHAAAPDKVALSHTAQGKAVTGTYVGSGSRMTGDERGSCAKVTGTEYLAAEQIRSECHVEPSAGPAKVTLSTTMGSHSISGTAVGRSSRVTGDEPGACRPVTGSQYYNTNDFADLCTTPSPRRTASVMSRPQRETAIVATGADFPKTAGDAIREAARITTPHASVHPFGLDRRNAVATHTAVAVIPAVAVTGDRPGAGGSIMTGDARGACLSVSGTPYIGEDNAPAECTVAPSGRFLPSKQANEIEPSEPSPSDFSIHTPARDAWERHQSSITGTAEGSQRITGPINKASGLITGTPDFRHRAAIARTDEVETPPAASRLSGEGAQTGRKITGDAWHAMSRVTGTEGASALSRNPSMRGESRGAGVVGAREFRSVERTPAPESRVTGSAGNSSRGALVTVSGGARA